MSDLATGSHDYEPPTGSVVAIDLGGPREEIWVSDSANIGNWYCARVPFKPGHHPVWSDVRRRAEGRAMMLLVQSDDETWRAGYEAGVQRAISAVEELAGDGVRP